MGSPILHVTVVGFHHIKGYQLEYAYPPFVEEGVPDSRELPEPWKHLPSLALPDGAHNYEEDTIYFHLPALDNPKQSIFGISCYRQIDAEKLLRRGSEVTRSSVQKSVCVLSRLPLFGLIQAKLQLVTHAYFEERDFSKVSLLQDTFHNLNSLLSPEMLQGGEPFLGLSSRDLVLHFKHKAVLLFKLFLLERKVLFYKSPVKDLCSTILTLCSLFPGMMERGLQESASIVGLKQVTAELRPQEHDFLEVSLASGHSPSELKQSLDKVATEKHRKEQESTATQEEPGSPEDLSLLSKTIRSSETKMLARRAESLDQELVVDASLATSGVAGSGTQQGKEDKWEPGLSLGSVGKDLLSKILPASLVDVAHLSRADHHQEQLDQEDKLVSEIEELLDSDSKDKAQLRSKLEFVEREDSDAVAKSPPLPSRDASLTTIGTRGSLWSKLPSAIYSLTSKDSSAAGNSDKDEKGLDDPGGVVSLNMGEAVSREQEDVLLQSIPKLLALQDEDCGLPLLIFSKGSLCLPYVSLPIIDLLGDISVRSCVVGATNDLFKQKKHLFDVIVEVDECKINILDEELRKQLYLTMEDLRFADYLVKNVLDDTRDLFLEGTCWQGGEEWLRAQFKVYLVSLLRTAQVEDVNCKDLEAFNTAFLSAWKTTHNFKMWNSVEHPCLQDIPTGHFYRGQLSVADMRLRIAHSIQSSERGRKLNQAVVSTGRVVAHTTGKVVGGALTSAKSVVSSLWSHFSPATPSSSVESLPPSREDSAQTLAPSQE